MSRRIQVVAQVVGFVTIGTLALFGVLSLFNAANPAVAALGLRAPQVPQVIEPAIVNYQGMLYDDLGAPLSGAYTLTFRLYDDVMDPVTATLWAEEIGGVTVRDGYFSALLGETTPIDYADFAQPDTYIGIQVGGYDELMPRQRFATVPYAFYASRASGLTAPDGDPANAVTVDIYGNVRIPGSVNGDLDVKGDLGAYSLDVGSGSISGGSISGSSLDVGSGAISGGDISGSDISGDSLDVGSGAISGGDVSANDIDWSGDLEGFNVFEYTAMIPGLATVQMTSVSNSVCFLTRYNFTEIGSQGSRGDCEISDNSGTWQLEATLQNATQVICEAMCLRW